MKSRSCPEAPMPLGGRSPAPPAPSTRTRSSAASSLASEQEAVRQSSCWLVSLRIVGFVVFAFVSARVEWQRQRLGEYRVCIRASTQIRASVDTGESYQPSIALLLPCLVRNNALRETMTINCHHGLHQQYVAGAVFHMHHSVDGTTLRSNPKRCAATTATQTYLPHLSP